MVKEREHLDPVETAPLPVLRERALQRIQQALAHAYEHLPFYRERFDAAGVRPETIGSLEEFSALVPRFKKADIIDAMRATGTYQIGIEDLQDGRPANVVLTSGTQGFNTFASLGRAEVRASDRRDVAREMWMQKIRPGMRVLILSPGWHYLSLRDNHALTQLGARVICPWGTFIPRFAGDLVDAIRIARPDYVLTVTNMLYAVLEECSRRGLDTRKTFDSVRYIAAVGEPITPQQRELLVEELGLLDVFERGGSSDGLWGGGECFAHRGHHVFMDLYYLEVVDPVTGRPVPAGQKGSIVVTNLVGDRSVYIRFDGEDWGEMLEGPCPCGRTHQMVEIHDRMANLISVRGRLIAPYEVRRCLDSVRPLTGVPFFVVRYAADMPVLRLLVHQSARNPLDLDVVTGLLRERFDVPVEARWVGSIPQRWKARTVVEADDEGVQPFLRQ